MFRLVYQLELGLMSIHVNHIYIFLYRLYRNVEKPTTELRKAIFTSFGQRYDPCTLCLFWIKVLNKMRKLLKINNSFVKYFIDRVYINRLYHVVISYRLYTILIDYIKLPENMLYRDIYTYIVTEIWNDDLYWDGRFWPYRPALLLIILIDCLVYEMLKKRGKLFNLTSLNCLVCPSNSAKILRYVFYTNIKLSKCMRCSFCKNESIFTKSDDRPDQNTHNSTKPVLTLN